MSKVKQDKPLFEDQDILIRNNSDFLFTEVDGESVVMNIETGQYFGMNSVSTDIWHLLEIEKNFQDLMKQILEQYDVDEKTCDADTRPAINRMLLSKLLLKKEVI